MKRQKNLEVKKATILAMVVNSLQILMVGVIVLYMYMTPGDIADLPLARALVAVAAAVVIWGGVIDIRDALDSRKLLQQLDDMDQTIEAQEDLNITLRAQRHDFLNHLQVVYSLIEMKEYKEANDYIERVYGSIASVGKVLRTANPAINALLQVKLGVCEKAGIQVKLDIRSAWKDLSIPGWEMCKVLGNLLDNAIDALQEVSDRRLTLTLTEDLKAFRFSVKNSGPMIPVKLQASIFQPGITTKAAGHGMGLFIVRRTVQEWGGDIRLISDAKETEFSGFIPREVKPQDKTKKEKR
ncbi:MAG TPA: Spo0B domain-containing protein [Candidatus Egerieenecus merdigallinarum]|nr:Spo0B domain-containing protein [Candidatus Egerieenecus merdigallinarum]